MTTFNQKDADLLTLGQHVADIIGQGYTVLSLQGILLKELYWCHHPRKRDCGLFEKWKISQLKETGIDS